MPNLSNSPSLRAKGYVIKTEASYPLGSLSARRRSSLHHFMSFKACRTSDRGRTSHRRQVAERQVE
jgi:hypothetical protein